jgi:hypothetical protein
MSACEQCARVAEVGELLGRTAGCMCAYNKQEAERKAVLDKLHERVEELETAVRTWADVHKDLYRTTCKCSSCALIRLIYPPAVPAPDTRLEDARRDWASRVATRVSTMEAALSATTEDPPTPKTGE